MRKVLALFAVLTLGTLAAACGSDDSDISSASSTATSGDAQQHNDADVTFAQGMIPHHAQAVEMADMALDTSEDDELLVLANKIKEAQQPEIDQMTGWLKEWGEPVEAAGSGQGGGHSMGSDAMGATMMSDEEMDQLHGAKGDAFDQMWLTMMIRHHEGAIKMAEQHQSNGKSAEALALSKEIIRAQQAEIEEMRGMIS